MMLELAHILLSVVVTIMLIYLGKKAMGSNIHEKGIKKIYFIVGGLMLWHAYIWIMTRTGILEDFVSFPPKFFIFLILPAFIFTGVFAYSNKSKSWLTHLPAHWLIYVQVYRVGIEILFVYALAREMIPPQVTIEGYNFDMIFAATAIPVAYMVHRKRQYADMIALYWNYMGLAVIASIITLFMTSIYLPERYTSAIYISTEFAQYPFVLVAGFLMPAAVFLHVISIVQLRNLY